MIGNLEQSGSASNLFIVYTDVGGEEEERRGEVSTSCHHLVQNGGDKTGQDVWNKYVGTPDPEHGEGSQKLDGGMGALGGVIYVIILFKLPTLTTLPSK